MSVHADPSDDEDEDEDEDGVDDDGQRDSGRFFTVFEGSAPEDVSHARRLWSSLSLLPPLESRLVSSDIRQRLPVCRPQRGGPSGRSGPSGPSAPEQQSRVSAHTRRRQEARQEERRRYEAMADQRREILALLRRQREQRIHQRALPTQALRPSGKQKVPDCDQLDQQLDKQLVQQLQ